MNWWTGRALLLLMLAAVSPGPRKHGAQALYHRYAGRSRDTTLGRPKALGRIIGCVSAFHAAVHVGETVGIVAHSVTALPSEGLGKPLTAPL